MTQRILLTGARGFLGHHVQERLLDARQDVIAPRRPELDVTRELGDFGKIDTVVHLAAQTFVPHSWQEPALFYRVNAAGTVNVLDYCRRNGVSLVFVSAYCYGQPDTLPIVEEAPLRPSNPYAYSKICAEDACRFYTREFGVPVTVLRPFNIYGPGQDARFLIPSIVRQVLAPDSPAIELPDTRPRRDYVHVADVARAVVAATLKSHAGGHTYNVGSGRSHSVAEVARLVMDAAGVSRPIVDQGKVRENEIPDTIADISAIGRDLGWRPAIEFERGLGDLVVSLRAQAR